MDSTNIFEGVKIRLTAIDPKTDAEVESAWTHAIDYACRRRKNPVRPMSPGEVRKDWEEKLKESDETRNTFYFAIRGNDAEAALVGFMVVDDIEWTNGQGFLSLFFKDDTSTAQYLPESLEVALRYVFNELNLYHIWMAVPAYASVEMHILEEAGFILEARQREMLYKAGRHHDQLLYGLLAEEWRQGQGRRA